MPFIYKITNGLTGNFYIGKTKYDFLDRYEAHKKNASDNVNTILYKAMRHYGVENFVVEEVEQCLEEELNTKEVEYISSLKPSYNMTSGGDGGSTTHNRRWITDGIVDKYIFETDSLPEGWRYGRTKCVFNDREAQKDFSSRVDREKVGKVVSEGYASGRLKISEENRKAMSVRMTGDKNPTKRPEVAEKISLSQKKHYAENPKPDRSYLKKQEFCHHCMRMVASHSLKRWHLDNCKMAPQKDNEIPRAEERRKLSESTKLARDKEKLMPPIQCPHCKKESIGKGAMKKWHFDNCKLKDKNE